jgi:hypothetical protein
MSTVNITPSYLGLSEKEEISIITWPWPSHLPYSEEVAKDLVTEIRSNVGDESTHVSHATLEIAARALAPKYTRLREATAAAASVYEAWAIRRESDWPHPWVPQNEATAAKLWNDALKLGGGVMTEEKLDLALDLMKLSAVVASPDAQAVKNERGLTDAQIQLVVARTLDTSSLANPTKTNLEVAMQILASEGKLTFKKRVVEPEKNAITPEQLGRVQSESFLHKDRESVTKEAIEKAQKTIVDVYRSSTPEMKKHIDDIKTAVGNVPDAALVVIHEMGSLREVLGRFHNPPGELHMEREEVRKQMREIIEEERAYSKQVPEAAKATWTRILRTFEERIDPKFSRSIR